VNSEMHLGAMIDRGCRYTGMPCLSEFGDAIGDRDLVDSKMHLETMIERVWTWTWRPRLSELRDALRGCD
jgi:hypothetical protein